jgi:hypothetical protein
MGSFDVAGREDTEENTWVNARLMYDNIKVEGQEMCSEPSESEST